VGASIRNEMQRGDHMLIDRANQEKLDYLGNEHVLKIVKMAIEICRPAKVTVTTDSEEDISYVRQLALQNGEETALAMEGHTIHFDGYYDQARDKEHTKYLLPEGVDLGAGINAINREEGLDEIVSFLEGSMKGKEMLVRFFSLGPCKSRFTIPAMQITDSAYVAHSEDFLYRQGYEEFKRLNGSADFFYFIHSAGRLENGVSRDVDKRRIYIDLVENRVFSVNTQYAGNTVGLKKLAFRLAIRKASAEDWLAEHMFLMGVHGPGGRVTYFTGAFPSACGKTSTAMIPGHSIVGDDITYIRNVDGEARGVNVESGIFGIIRDVNPDDDPVIYQTLTTPREVIFSNVLVHEGKPYWLGMGQDLPGEGVNFSGKWFKGKTDPEGNEITPAHKNARYTIRITDLENADPGLHATEGVPIQGFVYGGRDSDTSVPVAESLSWAHGVFIGASLESETTAATLGEEGQRKHNPMANLDFLSIPLGKYIENHLRFGTELKKAPAIFCVNYFLRDEETGKYLNSMSDKNVWIRWMEGRVNGEFRATGTPIGYIPRYEDLADLFAKLLGKNYSRGSYERQFSIRVGKYLRKLERIEAIYRDQTFVPDGFTQEINKQRQRLEEARAEHGSEIISPFAFKR